MSLDTDLSQRLARWGHPTLLALLIGMFFVQPWAASAPRGDILTSLLYAAILLGSLVVVSDSRRVSIIALIVLIPALVLGVGEGAPDWSKIAGSAATCVFIAIVIAAMLRHIFIRPRVTPNVLMGALSVFLLIGVAWGSLYRMADIVMDDPFTGVSELPGVRRTQFFYLSFVTLTTLGYGDITPVTPVTMSLTAVEAIVGQAYLVILVAYLVARLVSEHGPDLDS
jgi:voltage-gated potassium channel